MANYVPASFVSDDFSVYCATYLHVLVTGTDVGNICCALADPNMGEGGSNGRMPGNGWWNSGKLAAP